MVLQIIWKLLHTCWTVLVGIKLNYIVKMHLVIYSFYWFVPWLRESMETFKGFDKGIVITKFLWGSHWSGWFHQAGRGCGAQGSGMRWCGEQIRHLHLVTKVTKPSSLFLMILLYFSCLCWVTIYVQEFFERSNILYFELIMLLLW